MTNEIKKILDILEGRKKMYLHQQKNNSPFNDEEYIAYMVIDYITNLQEDLANYVNVVLHNRKVIDNLQQRIEKAIEYIEENTTKEYEVPLIDSFSISYQKLVDILRGEK